MLAFHFGHNRNTSNSLLFSSCTSTKLYTEEYRSYQRPQEFITTWMVWTALRYSSIERIHNAVLFLGMTIKVPHATCISQHCQIISWIRRIQTVGTFVVRWNGYTRIDWLYHALSFLFNVSSFQEHNKNMLIWASITFATQFGKIAPR